MKITSRILCFLLLFATTVPLYINAENAEITKEIANDIGVNFIIDSPELVIYQYEKDGISYETHEHVEKVDNTEIISIKIYKIEGNEKLLIDNGTTVVSELTSGMLELTSEDGEKVLFDSNNSSITAFKSASYGGSYVSDVRYRVFTDGTAEAIMAGQNPYYKNTTKNNANFIRFQGHADALKSKELDLITFGVLGFADDIINALKAGNLLSWSLIKKIVGGAVKVGPFGAALTIYQYGQEWLDAREDYKKI